MRETDRFLDLRRAADEGLGGLTADEALWQSIQARAKAPEKPLILRPRAWVPAVAAIAAALVLLLGSRGGLTRWSTGDSFTAGAKSSPAGASQSVSVSIGSAQRDDESNLLLVKGQAYLLTGAAVGEKLLGKELGSVTEYTRRPSLSDDEIVSSVVSSGESVYAVKDVPGLVAARVDGKLVSFQRISVPGRNSSGEGLKKLLCDPGQVESIVMGGKTLKGDEARKAMRLLCEKGEKLNERLNGGEEVRIGLKNGLTLYLLAADDCAAACGTWYCPEFFECFR